MASAPDLSVARSSLDFEAYGALRAKAQRDQGAALKETAHQFEAMFLQLVMKSMRATVTKSDLLNSQAMETYESLYDRELATVLSRRGGIGLADMLTQQLDKAPSGPVQSTQAVLSLHPEAPALPVRSAPAPRLLPERTAQPLPLRGDKRL